MILLISLIRRNLILKDGWLRKGKSRKSWRVFHLGLDEGVLSFCLFLRSSFTYVLLQGMSWTTHGYRVSLISVLNSHISLIIHLTVPFSLISHWYNGHSTSNLIVQLLSMIWLSLNLPMPILFHLKWSLNLEQLKPCKVFVSWWKSMDFDMILVCTCLWVDI